MDLNDVHDGSGQDSGVPGNLEQTILRSANSPSHRITKKEYRHAI